MVASGPPHETSRCRPSGLNAACRTRSGSSKERSGPRPSAASLMWASRPLHVTRALLSGESVAKLTGSPWMMGGVIGSPVSASQTRASRPKTVTRRFPSDPKRARWQEPAEGRIPGTPHAWRDRLAGCRVEDLGLGAAGDQDPLPIGAENGRPDRAVE